MGLSSANITYWIMQTVAMLLTALLIPRLTIKGPISAFLMVVAIALVNALLWDAALFFKVPDHLSIKALLLFFANGALFWGLVKIVPGVEVTGFLPALAAPVVFTVCSVLIDQYGKEIDWNKVYVTVTEGVGEVKQSLSEDPTPSPTSPASTVQDT